MARLPRLVIPGQVHHVLVRGNNQQPVYADDEDRRHFMSLLATLLHECRVALHGFVLLPTQFQLLLTPADEAGLSKLMQSLGRRYASGFNRRHQRTGTLWEGRYRSLILEPGRHLMHCMVWMDTQPVRQHLCTQARDYPWSSCMHHLGLSALGFITPHPVYWSLGNTPFAREAAYANRIEAGLTGYQVNDWNSASLRCWVMGAPDFVSDLQKLTSRRLTPGQAGRPRKMPEHRTKARLQDT